MTTNAAVDLTPPTPAPEPGSEDPAPEPAAPRFPGTPATDLTRDHEGIESVRPPHPAIAAQAAERLAEQDLIVRAASTALRDFPKAITEAIAPIQTKLADLEASRNDYAGEAFARKHGALSEELHVTVDKVQGGWESAAEKMLKVMGRDFAPPYPIRSEDATTAQLTLAQLTAMPFEPAVRQFQKLVDRALDDVGDDRTRAVINFLLPVLNARLEGEDDPTPEIRTTLEWGAFVLDDTQTYRGKAGVALVASLRRQVELVAATVKDEGRWVGSSTQRVVRSGPGGVEIANPSTPDLLPC